MNGTLFQEGLESRDQVQQERATLLQQHAAIAERLNALGVIPPEPTAQETPVARTRDMGKTPEPWEGHEVIIRAVLLAQYFAEDWAYEVEDWRNDCTAFDYYRVEVPNHIAQRIWMAKQNYAKLGEVKCRKSNLEAICLLRAFMASQLYAKHQRITTACILNRICTIGYLSHHLCHEIFGANPDDLMVGGKQRRAALGFIHDRIDEFVAARVFEPVEEKQYPEPRAHATKQKLCEAWQKVWEEEDLPF